MFKCQCERAEGMLLQGYALLLNRLREKLVSEFNIASNFYQNNDDKDFFVSSNKGAG